MTYGRDGGGAAYFAVFACVLLRSGMKYINTVHNLIVIDNVGRGLYHAVD